MKIWCIYRNDDYGGTELCQPYGGEVFEEQRSGGLYRGLRNKYDKDVFSFLGEYSVEKHFEMSYFFKTEEEAKKRYRQKRMKQLIVIISDASKELGDLINESLVHL